jgi:protoheme IX farnesyltransferase
MSGPARRVISEALDVERGLVRAAADWIELTKPRIAAYVVFAAFAGGVLGGEGGAGLSRALLAALLVGATAASAGAFNQILERDLDRRMERTANRPLVTGRIRMRDAVLFATAACAVGVTGLATAFNLLSALLALATVLGYALVYTPLKRVSTFNTVAGAIPGAMPALIGAAAVSDGVGPWGWMLFAVVFAWQFPHFLAIAWIHREDYARAGMKMLPALPGVAGLAGRQALAYALLLLPVSLLPAARGEAGALYGAAALVLGLGYALAAAGFAWRETTRSARALLYASLVYLPVLFLVALVDGGASPTPGSMLP